MMKLEDCPCIDCICLPACKTKMYSELLTCDMINDYLYIPGWEEYQGRLLMVIKTFKLEPVYIYHKEDKVISQNRTFGDDRYEPPI